MWVLLSSFFFASMSVCVKYASATYSSAELVFWRGTIGMVFVAILAKGRGVGLRTEFPRMHALRSLVGGMSLACAFYSIAHMPLATAMTLGYMSSIWIAVFLVGGALLTWIPRPGKEGGDSLAPLQLPLIGAVIAGFAGVLLILKPSSGGVDVVAGVVGLMAGMLAALAYMQVMALSRIGEPEIRVVFYFAFGSALMGAAWMPFSDVSAWSWKQSFWLLLVGITAALAQLCLTKAYASARTDAGALVVAGLQYSAIVFGSLYAVFAFGESIDIMGWVGIALVIGSGIFATRLRQKSTTNGPAEDR
jgi:drug/metabolite transporter (DMT)-like permease